LVVRRVLASSGIFALCLLGSAGGVYAADCTAPNGPEGQIIYNQDWHVPQYCDGTSWVAAGPFPGAGGPGCTGPDGPEGRVIYNQDHHVLQYCDGTNWEAMGPVGGGGGSAPTSGLVGHWKLDESSGSSVTDATGNGHTLALRGNPSWQPTGGKINGALDGDGNGDSAYRAEELLGNQAWSFAAWVYVRGVSSSNFSSLISNEVGMCIIAAPASGVYDGFACSDDSLSDGKGATPTYASLQNAWHHFAATHAADGTYTLYVDGVQSGTPGNPDGNGIGYGATSIGGDPDGSYSLDGLMDDVRIYSRALSAAEITTIYNATGCANPAGTEGAMLYNTAQHVLQYCNGEWVGVGK
jgi:hypothetical protein